MPKAALNLWRVQGIVRRYRTDVIGNKGCDKTTTLNFVPGFISSWIWFLLGILAASKSIAHSTLLLPHERWWLQDLAMDHCIGFKLKRDKLHSIGRTREADTFQMQWGLLLPCMPGPDDVKSKQCRVGVTCTLWHACLNGGCGLIVVSIVLTINVSALFTGPYPCCSLLIYLLIIYLMTFNIPNIPLYVFVLYQFIFSIYLLFLHKVTTQHQAGVRAAESRGRPRRLLQSWGVY